VSFFLVESSNDPNLLEEKHAMLTESSRINEAGETSVQIGNKGGLKQPKSRHTVKSGVRYFTNLITTVADQRDYSTAANVGREFLASELVMMTRFAWQKLSRSKKHQPWIAPSQQSREEIKDALARLGTEIKEYQIDGSGFRAHMELSQYPSYYAGGPREEGGAREMKLLEYFVSLDLLNIQPTDVVVDIASNWSVFPKMVQEEIGAEVYRQDLIYPMGRNGQWIGGNAASMPVPDGFADKLVLHNAFEHFEGTSDTAFITEAWRVLKPGGLLCILPLFLRESFTNLTDPLVSRRGVVWDKGAQVVEQPWWHNRFGRFYDAAALNERVLQPAANLGFNTTIYYVTNAERIHPLVYLNFALVMQKP